MYFYILIILLSIILVTVSFGLIKLSKLKTEQLLAVRTFQEENNMNNRDLKIFKETMMEAKDQIVLAEGSVDADELETVSVLTAIKGSKEIFKYLMDNPKDITLYDDFLYRSLPAFSNSLERKKTIIKSQIEGEEITQTQEALDNIIQELSKAIIFDYNRCMQEELSESVIEESLVKKGDDLSSDERKKE